MAGVKDHSNSTLQAFTYVCHRIRTKSIDEYLGKLFFLPMRRLRSSTDVCLTNKKLNVLRANQMNHRPLTSVQSNEASKADCKKRDY